jgi:hypothetical protein
MYKLKVSKTQDYFEVDGKPFFYLADTMWSAFTNVKIEEWEEYLNYRRMQGFNAIQINILPQWDRSKNEVEHTVCPFNTIENDINEKNYAINYDYFDRAKRMVKMAVDKGFVPVLVLLWCNYVEGTWAAKRTGDRDVIPKEFVKSYVEYVVKAFSKYNPIYFISGDTNFIEGPIKDTYTLALETVKSISPEALVSFHSQGESYGMLPEYFVNCKDLDFYAYQSSHALEGQFYCYTMAEEYNKKTIKRPIINAEPCYEGMRCGSNNFGRFNEYHVRKATWQSLLSGAKAGIAYGAHGLWSFHKTGASFEIEDFAFMPYEWRTALNFKGAWDVAFAKWVFENFNLFNIKAMDLLDNDTKEIRLAAAEELDKLIVYTPYSTDIKIRLNLSGYKWTLINLENKHFGQPNLLFEDGMTCVKMYPFNSDALLIGIKEYLV